MGGKQQVKELFHGQQRDGGTVDIIDSSLYLWWNEDQVTAHAYIPTRRVSRIYFLERPDLAPFDDEE